MNLFTRYVLTQVAAVFLITLGAVTFMMLVGGIAKEAIEQGLGVSHVIQLVPYILPQALLFGIPGALLMAVTVVYGRMAATNEVIAIKALGISPLVLIWPTLIFATLLSFVTFWLNDVAVSRGFQGAQNVVLDNIESIAYGILRTQHSFASKQLSMSVRSVEGHRLILPTISLQASADSPAVTIAAEEAELFSKPGSRVLTIRCYNGTIDFGNTHFDFPDELEREIALDDFDAVDIPPAHLPLSQMPEKIAEVNLRIDQGEERAASEAGYAMMAGDFASLSGPAWQNAVWQLGNARAQLVRMQVESPRRWANGFSCLCFALIGAPWAIRMRHSDAMAIFFTCFLVILLVYYPLMMYGVDRAKAGAIPATVVWLPNVAVALWGFWTLRKVVRY